MEHEWKGFKSVKKSDMMKKVETSVSKKDLDKVNNEISIIVDKLFINAENEIDSNSEDLMRDIY